jgi:hypothetical protein
VTISFLLCASLKLRSQFFLPASSKNKIEKKILRTFLSFFLLRPALNLLNLKLWSSSLALGRAFALPVELPATGAAAAAAGASSSPSRVLPPAAIIPGRPITNLK